MAQDSPCPPQATVAEVRLEVWQGPDPSIAYEVPESGFLIGSVPGCDLRLPGVGLPPVICLITPRTDGAAVRKLSPTQSLMVNDAPLTGSLLRPGDQLRIGPVALVAHISLPPSATSENDTTAEQAAAAEELVRRTAELDEQARLLDERSQQLNQQTQELEADRVIWYQRREEMEREARQLQEQQRDIAVILANIAKQKQTKEEPPEPATSHKPQAEPPHQDSDQGRRELYDKYRQRSDRIAAMEAAVRKAAQNIQERKRQVEEEAAALTQRRQEITRREAELAHKADELTRDRQVFDDEKRLFEEQQQHAYSDLAGRETVLRDETTRLQTDRDELQQERHEHEAQNQAEVLRLDRLRTELDDKHKQADARRAEIDARYEQLQRDSRDLEEQAQQLDDWHKKLAVEAERLAKQAAEFDGRSAELARRAAAVDGQQTMLTALRVRLERAQEDARREAQELTQLRLRQEAAEADLQRQRDELQRLHAGVDERLREVDLDRQVLQERQAVLDKTAAEVRQLQERAGAAQESLNVRAAELDTREAAHAREVDLYKTQADQLAQMQEKLALDRQVLREREAELNRIEQAREVLQEQLRRRSEELAERQKSLAEQNRLHAEAVAALERRHAELDQQQQATEDRAAALERLGQELSRREDTLNRQIERLKEAGRKAAEARKELHEARQRWTTDQQEAQHHLQAARAVADGARGEAVAVAAKLPELEQRAEAAIDRLAQAREQLREHLGELHHYAQQSQEDVDRLRAQVQTEHERVRQESLACNRAREEHRLAVTAFRQQVIDWQGQVSEMRRALAQDESRLQRRQAEVEADSARVARQVEELQVQERVVAEQRGEMSRHLADMREWYRRKLRELTERWRGSAMDPEAEAGDADSGHRDILSLQDDLDPGDRKLGELLQSLQLVEADTLASLLVEARQQRRSLRQMLLASGWVTLYQMALIETGNLGALMLGPVRVVDRLRATAHECVYRVVDPRRASGADGGYAVLRHLGEADNQDAVRPDEFRQRFAAAATVRHDNIAATFEVLEIAGRPAVLQEWLTGLPATEWPAFVAAPGVLFRLLHQAALGLQAAHAAGLVHGHLDADHVLVTTEGTLKFLGFGEPTWLIGREGVADDPSADLSALGDLFTECIEGAAPRRKSGKAKPLPEPLTNLLYRLRAEAGDDRYASATDLLADLDGMTSDIPDSQDAWNRLLAYVADQLGSHSSLRQTA